MGGDAPLMSGKARASRTLRNVPRFDVRNNVPLAPFTTLGVGGPAELFALTRTEDEIEEAVSWARAAGHRLSVLGGGTNLVVSDEGIRGLVIQIGLRGRRVHHEGGDRLLTVAAGEPWDDVVAYAVSQGWSGIECLSGIPGLVGATPIQNVGAYGQEVADTVTEVRVYDRGERLCRVLPAEACQFQYRDSLFKSGTPERYVVLAVTFRLTDGGSPTLRYGDLERALAGRGLSSPSLADVREGVLAVRRSKSMVLDTRDPNHRSCGSFFMNPLVSPPEAEQLVAHTGDPDMPRWPAGDGRVKLSAAWLMEQAGFRRGLRQGAVGLSSNHVLALVAHAGARAADVLGLARHLQVTVRERLGVRLQPEPVFWDAPTDVGVSQPPATRDDDSTSGGARQAARP